MLNPTCQHLAVVRFEQRKFAPQLLCHILAPQCPAQHYLLDRSFQLLADLCLRHEEKKAKETLDAFSTLSFATLIPPKG